MQLQAKGGHYATEFWKMNGGTLTIDVERDSAGHVTDRFLTGPTNIVCKGEITDESLTI